MSGRYRIGLIGGGNVAQRLGRLFVGAGHDVVAGVLRPAGVIAIAVGQKGGTDAAFLFDQRRG